MERYKEAEIEELAIRAKQSKKDYSLVDAIVWIK
jgi:hypothetical protein